MGTMKIFNQFNPYYESQKHFCRECSSCHQIGFQLSVEFCRRFSQLPSSLNFFPILGSQILIAQIKTVRQRQVTGRFPNISLHVTLIAVHLVPCHSQLVSFAEVGMLEEGKHGS